MPINYNLAAAAPEMIATKNSAKTLFYGAGTVSANVSV
jgi:hypothetical protein